MSEIPATPAAVFIVYHMCNPRGLPPIIFNGLGMPVPFFFFQAEDGIRAIGVTGVQTCALPIFILIGLVMLRETNRQLHETAEKNERNQNAIMRLLDEIEDLADGDLTVTASVTEDFTGTIADSINYSVDQLRDLVATINLTAGQVAAAVQETQATAMHLAQASEHQAQQISEASTAINEMAQSIDQVSANAAMGFVKREQPDLGGPDVFMRPIRLHRPVMEIHRAVGAIR